MVEVVMGKMGCFALDDAQVVVYLHRYLATGGSIFYVSPTAFQGHEDCVPSFSVSG
jgi:hypothetical protein